MHYSRRNNVYLEESPKQTMSFAPVVPSIKFAQILKHLKFNLIIFPLGLVWARPYPCPNKIQSKGWNSSSEDDLDMPPPTVVECTANCCWEAALRLWLGQSDPEPGAPASPNCWHGADIGMPTPRWSRHRKELACAVGAHMHCLSSAGAPPPLGAMPCPLDGWQVKLH